MHVAIVIGLLVIIVALLGVIAYLLDELAERRREVDALEWARLHGPVVVWPSQPSASLEPAPRG